jgi:hypothetical protein
MSEKPQQQLAPLHIDDETRRSPAWVRLEEQLGWYDRSSKECQCKYKVIKGAQLVLAASIPLVALSGGDASKWMTAFAGALIAIMEGVQQLGQYSSLWLTYRATAEYLKHEKYLFLSAAGPYKTGSREERLVLLAERVEERVSAEHANWVNETRRTVSKTSNPSS